MNVIAVALLVLATGAGLSLSERAEGLRAVERVRYGFTLNTTRPFDDVYPRSIFERKARQQQVMERLLTRRFGLRVTTKLLEKEFERIEHETRAPEQWVAIKEALGGDRRRVEEVFCRPALVERALRTRFDFDPRIHAGPHQRVREARVALLAGETPSGATEERISRVRRDPPSSEEPNEGQWLEPVDPRLIGNSRASSSESPPSVDPALARVLETQLKKPGDVTTILEERDRFLVFRLLSLTKSEWTVLAFQKSKLDFEDWYESEVGN